MKVSDWLLTCVSELHTANVEADPGQSGELLSLQHAAWPVLGGHHLHTEHIISFTATDNFALIHDTREVMK